MTERYEDTGKSARLEFCGDYIEIADFAVYQTDEDNPYNTLFTLSVSSDGFTGFGRCEYDIKEFLRFVRDIGEMYDFRRDRAELHDIGYGSKVVLEADRTGHITVSGVVYGPAAIHSVKFEFTADQTALKEFLKSLNGLLG